MDLHGASEPSWWLLSVTAAKAYLGRLAPGGFSQLAQVLLGLGVDSSTVRALAALESETEQARALFERVAGELGTGPMTPERATVICAVDVAERTITDQLSIDDALRELQDLSARMQKYGLFQLLDPLVFASDVWEDYPEDHATLEPAIRRELGQLIALYKNPPCP